MLDCDVLVVGAGPVGETLLALLGSRGVSAIGLEKDPLVWPKPRAVHFDGETVRTFQSIGLGDAIVEQCFPMLSYRMENEAGEVLLDIPTGRLGDQGWHDDYMFHQPDVDALLRSEIGRQESVSLLTGMSAVGISQDDGGPVTVRAQDALGHEHVYRARYLVGCDGASSFVRKSIGATWESLGPNDPWLIVDGTHRGTAPVEGSMVFYGHHSRPKIWAAMPGGRCRMEFKVLPADRRDAIVTPEAISEMTGGMLNPATFVINRTAVYTFRSALADRWRHRQVFLAGDAAHLAPPLYGQGLCSGIRDAANLAWKLDLVLRGCHEDVLDTYESERRPHVKSWIEQSTRMSVTIQTTDPQVAEARDEFLRSHPEDAVSVAPALGPGLHGDTSGPGGGGQLGVQPVIAGERRFDDVVGAQFVLAARASDLAQVPEGVQNALRASAFVHLLTEADPGFADLLAAARARSVVIRPDRYVLGSARTVDELALLCRRLATIVGVSTEHRPQLTHSANRGEE